MNENETEKIINSVGTFGESENDSKNDSENEGKTKEKRWNAKRVRSEREKTLVTQARKIIDVGYINKPGYNTNMKVVGSLFIMHIKNKDYAVSEIELFKLAKELLRYGTKTIERAISWIKNLKGFVVKKKYWGIRRTPVCYFKYIAGYRDEAVNENFMIKPDPETDYEYLMK